jgi:hypothetical protein
MGAPSALGVDSRFEGNLYSYLNLTKAEAISSLASWVHAPPFKLLCRSEQGEDYTWGPDTPELCVSGVNVTLVSSQFGNKTIEFPSEYLEDNRLVDASNSSVYVTPFPLFKYAVPNAIYDGAVIELEPLPESGDEPFSILIKPNTAFNFFNASSDSLRAYYGVPEDVVGSDLVSQGSTLYIGGMASAVNTSAVREYQDLTGLGGKQLMFPSWAAPNNLEVVLAGQYTSGAISETMLDVESMITFAPLADTYFLPNRQPLEALKAALVDAGLTQEQVNKTMGAFERVNLQTDDYESLSRLGAAEKNVTGEFFGSYLREFAENITAAGAPQVLSLSLTSSVYTELGVPYEVLEDVLRDLTLAGTTIMVSSGDNGSSGGDSGECFPASDPLQATWWPTTSPWVTVVGGTQFLADDNGNTQEVTCSASTNGGITSGGGFAASSLPQDLYGRPAWQAEAVSRYLSENNETTFDAFPAANTPGYNPSGRAYPDVSLYASFYPVITAEGDVGAVDGTSLATPLTASMFTLANQLLLEDGYETIGYANPMLYWMGANCTEAFNDITVGNTTAAASGEECLFGFPAAPGWDAATGLGSIKFEPFVACAKRYQDEVRSQGLELLPDGTYRGVIKSANPANMPSPVEDAGVALSVSHAATASLAILGCMLLFLHK